VNPWNRLVMIWAWVVVALAAGGTYLAHDHNIAFAALVINSFVMSLVLSGSDRDSEDKP